MECAKEKSYSKIKSYTSYFPHAPSPDKPVASVSSPQQVTATVGGTQRLTCAVSGNPAATYTWFKGASKLTDTNRSPSISFPSSSGQ